MRARRSSGDRGRAGADPVRSVIGRWIRENREFQHLTQAELCRSLRERGVQVSPSTLSRWERGEASPGADVLALLGVELGSSLAALEERIHAAMVRSREEIDVTGREPRELVERADRAARAGNYHRALALLEAADDLVRLSGDEAPGELHAGLLLRLAAVHMKFWHLETARGLLARYGDLAKHRPELAFRGLVYRLLLAQRSDDRFEMEILGRRLVASVEGRSPRDQAEGWQVWAGCRYRVESFEQAAAGFSRAGELWRDLGNHLEEGRTAAFRGYCLAACGEFLDGERQTLRALATARKHGYRDLEVQALHFQGRVVIAAGEKDRGIGLLLAAAGRASELRLRDAEFRSLYRAWEVGGGDSTEARLRRLLAHLPPQMEEARAFREMVARREEDQQ